MRFEQYLIETDISYEQYCNGLDVFLSVHEGILDEGLLDAVTGKVSKIFTAVKTDLTMIADDFGLGLSHLVDAFKSRDMFRLMKAIGFNIKSLFKAVNTFSTLFRKGLYDVFKEMHDTGMFQKLKSGVVKVDEIMDKYPLLKKVSGPVVAGLLFYMWTQMTFIGNLDFDFDFGDIAKALSGSYSLSDLFASPEGLMLSALFMTGSVVSVAWLGKTTYNMVLAITYTLMKSKGGDMKIIQNIKSSMSLDKL